MINIADTDVNALFIAPKKAMIDWANEVLIGDPLPYQDPLDHDNGSVYLVPEFNDEGDCLEWLKENFEEIFYEQLFAWCTDDTTFPPLTWEKFQEFCFISYQSQVFFVDEEE